MYSESSNRVFSQGGTLSQLTCPEIVPEEPLSSKADAICQQNRQIGNFVESSLKQIEKKRIKLNNKKSSIEEERRSYLEIHERQSQQSLELQMELEKWTEKYQYEMEQRAALLEKQKDTQLLVNTFDNYFAEGNSVANTIKRDKEILTEELKKNSAELDTVRENKNKIKSYFHTEMEEMIKKCLEQKTMILEERKVNYTKLQTIANQLFEKSNNINKIRGDIESHIKSKEELTSTFNDVTLQNKMTKEEITKVQQQLDEMRAVSASSIQTLRLNINTEQIKNSNLESKIKENDDHVNSLLTKQQELTNVANQIKVTIEETSKHNDKLVKKIEDNQDKKSLLLSDIDTLASQIQNNDSVQNANEFYKNNILILEESIKSNDINLKEKEDLCNKLNDQLEISKKILIDIEVNVCELNSKLNQTKLDMEELASNVIKEKDLFRQEREKISLQNKVMEQMNLDLAEKSTTLSLELQELLSSTDIIISTQKQIEDFIKKCHEDVKNNEDKLLVFENEWEEECEVLKTNIDIKDKKLGKLEELISEIRPAQDQLPEVTARRVALEQEIHNETEKYQKEKELIASNFNSKMKELKSEITEYISVMNNLCAVEVDNKKKMKEESKGIEKSAIELDNQLRSLVQELNISKNNESHKRIQIARLERQLKAINNEARLTEQDITRAINRKIQQKPMKTPSSTTSKVTSTSSVSKGLELPSKNAFNQKSMNLVPVDEYDFSEI